MKCPGCEKELEPWERAQAMPLPNGERHWPRSYCDACCKANLWPGGSAAALERLGTRDRDQAEVARIGEVTGGWLPAFEQAKAAAAADDDIDWQAA